MIAVELIPLDENPITVTCSEEGEGQIEIVTEENTICDIHLSSTLVGSGTGEASESMDNLTLAGDLTFVGANSEIIFTNGILLDADGLSMPYNKDLYIADHVSGNGNVQIGKTGAGTVTIKNALLAEGTATFEDYAYFDNDLGTPQFVSGFAGSGWKLDYNTDYTLTVDNLYVRKAMNVYELIINQIRATNGSLWVSDSAKVHHVDGLTCYIDTDDGTLIQPFALDDIVRCQKWTGRGIKYYSAKVTAIDAEGEYFTLSIIDGAGTPAAGDEIVRIGNETNVDRQGALYLTSSDDGAPYMDILDGVTNYSFTGKTKVRLGKLEGITDVDFGGELSGYGLYSNNVYLKGQIVIAAGSTGYDNITDKPDLDAIIGNLQAQIDGQIMTWFYDYVPTLSNLPASDWTTTEIRNDHLGDLFYNTSTGAAYRFAFIDSTFQWMAVTDEGVAQALAAAEAAQDTADHKRRVFVAQPVPPYDIGDLWVNGVDLFRCAVNRAGGSYQAGDFILATSYTEGATWGENLDGIPAMLGTPSGTGLFLSSTHMGFYGSGAWKTYIDNAGNFILGNIAGGGTGIAWNQATGVLNIKGVVNITAGSSGYAGFTDRPTSLSSINATEASKLAGIAAGATVGATWGVNLSGIPATLSAPTGSGLFLSSTYMGYYSGGAWRTYMDNQGNLVLGTYGSGGPGLFWSQGAATLSIRGTINAVAGSIGGWTIASDAIYYGTKKTTNGFATDGITLASNGSIHAERFYINADGTIGFSTSLTGKRIVIDSTNNRIELLEANGSNVTIDGSTSWFGTPGMVVEVYSVDTYYATTFVFDGIDFWMNKVEMYRIQYDSNGLTFGSDGAGSKKAYFKGITRQRPDQNSNLRYLYWDQVTGEIKAHTA